MVAPFKQNPLGGNLGIRTAVVYKLNAIGTVPVASLIELANPLSPNKVNLDVVDSEDWSRTWEVTRNPIQDFTDATSNISRNPDDFTISGTFISSLELPFLPILSGAGFAGIPGFGGGLRTDLLKMSNLEAIAALEEPVMVVTPRRSLATAFISSLSTGWNPDTGDNTLVTIGFEEVRIVSPSLAAAVADVAASATGNNAVASQGVQAGKVIVTQTAVPSPFFGLPPTLIPLI